MRKSSGDVNPAPGSALTKSRRDVASSNVQLRGIWNSTLFLWLLLPFDLASPDEASGKIEFCNSRHRVTARSFD
jgi:hypothetical protein